MKSLDEIHKIMEKVYNEEKGLVSEEKVKRIREESDRFLKERKINLRYASLREPSHILQ